MDKHTSRRDFLKLGATAGFGAVLGSVSFKNRKAGAQIKTPPEFFVADPVDPVRIGYVGVGGMGTAHVRNLLRIEGVEIRAICDIVEEHTARAQKLVEEAGQPKPEGYSRGETDFKRMCERDDLDLVYTATPWRWHVPVCVAAMESGKHAATEVPAALTINECWKLVETSERTKKYCIMMENCNYGRREMMILNMVRNGLLGELLHGECGYLHDLRALKFSDKGEGLWRTAHSIKRNANLYPTHGLGPVVQRMNINRGDQFDYLVSMSCKSRGLNLFAEREFGADDPRAQQNYALGDVNTSLIRTKNGCTIVLYHDCDTPRPYSRGDLTQGTKGIVHGYPDRIYIEEVSEKPHQWDDLWEYQDEWDHPLWKTVGEKARGAGHGGMDYLEDYRLIQCLRTGTEPDMDVYDAAALSVVIELSEISVANKSKPVDFPDFTRGTWKKRKPLGIVTG